MLAYFKLQMLQARTKQLAGHRPLWNEVVQVSIDSLPCTAILDWEENFGGRGSSARSVCRASFEIMISDILLEGFSDEWLRSRSSSTFNTALVEQKSGKISGLDCMNGPPRLRISCSFNRRLVEARQRGLWPTMEGPDGCSTLRPVRQLPAIRPAAPRERAISRVTGRSAGGRPTVWQPWQQKSFRDAFDYSGELPWTASSTVVESHVYSHVGSAVDERDEIGEGGCGGSPAKSSKPRPRTFSDPPALRPSRSFDVAGPRSDALASSALRSLGGGSADCALRRNSCGTDGGRSGSCDWQDAVSSEIGLVGEADDVLGPLVPDLAVVGHDGRGQVAAGARGTFLTTAAMSSGAAGSAGAALWN